MARIILIETSTSLCSTALAEDGNVVAFRESTEPRAHASMTAPFVQQILSERGLRVNDCDAVCVSKGPGSYTGLRVGSSTAKGLCFGAGIPLLAVSSLEVLVWQAIGEGLVPEGCKAIVPMIDARRMEVYSAVFSPDGRQLTETAPLVVEEGSFAGLLAEGPVLFIGDGALKCRPVIGGNDATASDEAAAVGAPVAGAVAQGDNAPGRLAGPGAAAATVRSHGATFVQTCPRAASMALPAQAAFDAGRFENTAYFEPFYLKDFVATVSRKILF